MLRQILTAVIVLLLASTLAAAETDTVLVFPFENQSTERNLDWIGEGIAELIIERLQSEPNLYVFQRDERLAGFDKLGIPDSANVSRATAMKLGWDNGSDRVITGRFTGTAEDFSIYARLIDLAAAGASQEIKVSGKLEDFIPLTNSLSWQVLKIIVPGTKTPESDYTSRPPVPRSVFENYIRGVLATDPQRRSDFFENAIRLQPNYSAALYQVGRLKHFEGDFKASNLRLEKLSQTDTNYIPAQFIIGLNHYRLGDFTKAAAVFQALPQSYDVLVNLGAALSAKGDTAAALMAWRRAADRDPYAVEAVFNSGFANFNRGEFDAAVRNLEQTLKLQGRDGEAMFLLSRSLERLGRLDEAQRLMAQATRMSPRVERWLTQPLPRLERLRSTPDIESLRLSGFQIVWTQERLARRAKGQELSAWLEFIQTQVDSQLFGDAIRELKEALLVYPRSSDAHILLAQIYERQRAFDQAVVEYELSISYRPAAESYLMLARVHKTMNQPFQALRAVENALRLEPDHAAAKAMKAELQKQPPRKQQ